MKQKSSQNKSDENNQFRISAEDKSILQKYIYENPYMLQIHFQNSLK